MEDIQIRICSEADLDLLAVLNKQLIEDEQHDNKMDVEQLRERMNGFINKDYKAYLFEKDSKTMRFDQSQDKNGENDCFGCCNSK